MHSRTRFLVPPEPQVWLQSVHSVQGVHWAQGVSSLHDSISFSGPGQMRTKADLVSGILHSRRRTLRPPDPSEPHDLLHSVQGVHSVQAAHPLLLYIIMSVHIVNNYWFYYSFLPRITWPGFLWISHAAIKVCTIAFITIPLEMVGSETITDSLFYSASAGSGTRTPFSPGPPVRTGYVSITFSTLFGVSIAAINIVAL